jgi:hypothetical protein
VEKYGGTGQTTEDSVIRRMRYACRITKATNTHLEYVIMEYGMFFHGDNGYRNASQCYIKATYIACLVRYKVQFSFIACISGYLFIDIFWITWSI